MPADLEITIQWPWGVWTDGRRRVASATGAGQVLIWNQFPERDGQPPDLRLRAGGQFGTPRRITSDGKMLIVADHNSRVTQLGQGNFVWKQFPQVENAPFDFFFSDPHDEAAAWLHRASSCPAASWRCWAAGCISGTRRRRAPPRPRR
jgi:hypothetical protein